jgi:cytidylate kinase
MPHPSPATLPFIIAIDGGAASGKGSLSQALAAHYRLSYLDTGLLYRAVGIGLLPPDWHLQPERLAPLPSYATADRAVKIAQELKLGSALAWLNDPQHQQLLRREQVSTMASLVATIPELRIALRQIQIAFAANPTTLPDGHHGAVIEGRDIGSVIAPQAQVKLFITADASVRAQRRLRQLQQLNLPSQFEDILKDIEARDLRDAPQLTVSRDMAHLELDNSQLNQAEIAACAMGFIDPHFRTWQKQVADL